ncbi:MAG: hypothetical protein ACRDZ4_02850 [Egibacteraceae bacterium]
MSTRPTIGRRRLLMGAMGGFGLSLGLRSLRPWPWIAQSRGADAARLARLLKHERSARVVGQEYLRAAPAEAERDALAGLVVGRLPAQHRTLSTVTDHQLRELLVLAVRQDFQEGRTVELHGWVVSLTEARLCALAARCSATAPMAS